LIGLKTIVWDVDDVLNNLTLEWFTRYWLVDHPNCQVRYDQLTSNPPHELLGIPKRDFLKSLDEFRLSDAGKTLEPVPEVLAWFTEHGEKYRHLALTATAMVNAPFLAAWVMAHFGRWIRSFTIVPSPREGERLPAYDQNKAEFLLWLGKADIMVDDSPANILEAGSIGIKTVIIPRPWNQSKASISEATRQLNWLAG
jgi:hypothetical protein